MQKYKKIIILLLLTIFLSGCGKEEYKVNEKITLKGTVSTTEIIKDNEKRQVKVLNLDEPIIIDGTKINKIELDYDKTIKDNYNVTIEGTIKKNNEGDFELSYAFEVIDVEDILSFVNTFGNSDFTFAIPSDIIKDIIIKEVNRGFAIYSSDNPDYEIFRISAVTKEEFNNMFKQAEGRIEKVASNRTKVVIIMFNSKDNDTQDYEITSKIVSAIPKIKNTVQVK